MKIGLLQCDHVKDKFRHITGDYSERFTKFFETHMPEVELVIYDVCHGVLPESPAECDGYIISGSSYSVYDDVDWIHDLANFVQKLHEHHHKTVGICFGHQMIAHALGGKVAKSGRGWGIGSKPVQLLQMKAWMAPEQPSYNLLLSHQDQVESVPDGAEILGGNEHCPISIFSIGDHLLGIQGHPEFTTAYAEALMDDRIVRIGAETIEAAKATLADPTDEALIARWIQRFFQPGIT